MEETATAAAVPPLRATVAALCANLVGIGLARFGYTPLIPALIAAGWFRPSAAVYLGAANLAGYLAGALGARWLAARTGAATTLRTAMALTAASLFACAFPLGFAWFFVWRFLSGATGGVLMALAAPVVMPIVPADRRGLAGGAIFTGVGLGIAASGTLVPGLIAVGSRRDLVRPRRAVTGADGARLEQLARRPERATEAAGAFGKSRAAGLARPLSRIRAERGGPRAAHAVPGRFRRPRAGPRSSRRCRLLDRL